MEAPKEPRRPTLRWDIHMRQVLCCLYRFFSCDKKQTMEIFSYMFRSHLNERGITGFVPFATLHTQWSWMRSSGDVVWYHVHMDTEFSTHAEWTEIVEKIRAAAEVLRFDLCEKTRDGTDTSLWKSRRSYAAWADFHASVLLVSHNMPKTTTSVKRDDDQGTITDDNASTQAAHVSNEKSSTWHESEARHSGLKVYEYRGKPDSDCSTETLDFVVAAPKEPRQVSTNDPQTSGQTDQVPKKHDQSHDLSVDKVPPLLYRWWNIDSQGTNSKYQFRSGLFCNRETFNPEDITESEFKAFFRGHVTKQEVASPFISTFSFPLAPIHRALISQKGAMVSIIDTSKVTSKIFYACPLADLYTQLERLRRVSGLGEIPAEAIVSTLDINTMELIALLNHDINRLLQLQVIRDMPRCNQKLRDVLAMRHKWKSSFQCGLTLRKLLVLLQIPRAYWEDLAPKFARGWGWKYAAEKRVFLEGVLSRMPYSQEELSDSESEWVMPPQTTPKKPSSHLTADSDEEDWESEESEQCYQECSDLQRKLESLRKSPRKPFFYRGDISPDLGWIPPEQDEDPSGHSDSDNNGHDASETRSISMEEQSDTTADSVFLETVDSASDRYEDENLINDHMALDWEHAPMPENTQTGMPPQDHNVDFSLVHGSLVHPQNRDTEMDVDGSVSDEEDDPSAQRALEREWPSDDDCPDMNTLSRVRFG
ncbi:hypothetical protein N7467_009105 [Penicillium canescens]|nr:hypothetical protein N7467_009105 [Penicillium canescens]